jgi:hypothetical protein
MHPMLELQVNRVWQNRYRTLSLAALHLGKAWQHGGIIRQSKKKFCQAPGGPVTPCDCAPTARG